MTAVARALARTRSSAGPAQPAASARRVVRTMPRERDLAYEGTTKNRSTESWIHPSMDPVALASQYLPLLVQRSRDLARRNPLAITALNVLEDNVAGTTFRVVSSVRDPERGADAIDEATSRECEAYFEAVSTRREIDSRGLHDYPSLRALVTREYLEAGEVFVLEHADRSDRSRLSPFSVELIPAERVDPTFSRPASKGKRRITNGIEFDSRGRRVAYHVTRADGSGGLRHATERIPADRMLHIYRPSRAGQERGVPILFGAMMLANDLDALVEAELTSAQVAACLTAFIEREGAGITQGDQDKLADGSPIYEFRPGAVFDLQPGEKVNAIDPSRPSGSFGPFADHITRRFARTTGLSYEAVSGDYSQVNYASGRLAHLADWKTFRRHQHVITSMFDFPMYVASLRWGAFSGRLPFSFSEWLADHHRLARARFVVEGSEHADPVKEATAAGLRMDLNLSTLADECAALGRDADAVIAGRERERRKIDEAGIPHVHVGGAAAATGAGNPGFQPEEGDA